MKFYLLQVREALRFKSGFTLFEILIYIALLALIAIIFSSTINLSRSGIVKIELEKLYTLAIYLQKKAILENSQQILTFANNSYYYDQETHNLPKDISFSSIKFKNNQIIFHPDGIISSGSIILADSSVKYKLTCSVATVNYLRKYIYNSSSNSWHKLTDFK